jgi:hypothetical protein
MNVWYLSEFTDVFSVTLNPHPAMKKKTLLIILGLTLAGIALAAGVKCIHCNGTGWQGRNPCSFCGGDGIFGNCKNVSQ